MVTRLEGVLKNGKDFLEKAIKFAEPEYDADLKKLRAIEKDLENDKKLTGAAKERRAKEIKDQQAKHLADFNRLKKQLDDDRQAIEDQKDKVENANTPQKKRAENRILGNLERAAIETNDKMLTARREHNILGEQGLNDAIKNNQEGSAILAKFKTATAALKMPKSVWFHILGRNAKKERSFTVMEEGMRQMRQSFHDLLIAERLDNV